MTIKINTLTVKNFMSVGNSTQAVDFNRQDLTLVLGENLDTGGGDAGSRNGVGKTTIGNALSYALAGKPLTNIRLSNLINKTNGKQMLVTVDFEKNGVHYRIERGRSPNVLKFIVDGVDPADTTNDAQGENRETQAEIENLLGMSHEMFKHIVVMNTYTEPFLSMRSNDQRVFIEQMLGITKLSEKAEQLKVLLKNTRDAIKEEEYNIQAIRTANEHITSQIASVERKQKLWIQQHDTKLAELATSLDRLAHVDVAVEIDLHQQHTAYNTWKAKLDATTSSIENLDKQLAREQKALVRAQDDLTATLAHKCYACGSELHDSAQDEIKAKKEQAVADAQHHIAELEAALGVATVDLAACLDYEVAKPDTAPEYTRLEDAYDHKDRVNSLTTQLENVLAQTDPYADQIAEMKSTGLQTVDHTLLNELNTLKDHQEFLLKLLTNKDSFIRKKIIDQNLSYLNGRLAHYLEKIGLPHDVEFQSDLSVEITDLGRDLDFDNLSRGERTRLILSLSWAFRDVWESMNTPINLMFIDELIDNGLDASGVENAIAIFKRMTRDRNKSIWLVSHRDELAGRVHNVMTVTKESGFTSYSSDVDVT